MDFKQHFIYCNLFLYRIFLDQGLNLFIQTYYKEIGPEIAFNIWWMFFYIVNIGKNTEVLCRHFILNKTKYFRLRPTDEVSLERTKGDLRLT